jgi:hypothetical protein
MSSDMPCQYWPNDGLHAFFFLPRHADPFEVLRFIASGWFGEDAFSMGLTGSLIGMVSHNGVSVVLAAIYVGASRVLPVLRRYFVPFGLAYGAGDPPIFYHGLISHAILVGVPIAFYAKKLGD